jgi:hypothetical protein
VYAIEQTRGSDQGMAYVNRKDNSLHASFKQLDGASIVLLSCTLRPAGDADV